VSLTDRHLRVVLPGLSSLGDRICHVARTSPEHAKTFRADVERRRGLVQEGKDDTDAIAAGLALCDALERIVSRCEEGTDPSEAIEAAQSGIVRVRSFVAK
jgi:hypothetical protein